MARRGTGIISVLISGDASPLGKAFDKAGGMLTNFGKAAGVAVAAVGAAVGVAAVKLGKDAVNAASDLNESINAVNVTFEDSAAGILALSENASKAVGLSAREFNGFAVQFAGFTNTIAGSEGDVVAVTEELTTRIADFASVMNLDVPDAAQVFQSSLAGETEPIRRFGIDLSAAAIGLFAVERGLVDSASEMTEADKVTARYLKIMEDTEKMAGDFANTSDGLANSQRILAADIDNAKASLGEAFLPAMESITSVVLERLVPAFETFADWFKENEPAITAFISEVLDNIIETVGNVISTFQEWYRDHGPSVVESFQNIADPVRRIWDTLGDIVTNVGELIGKFSDGNQDADFFAATLSWVGDSLTTIFDVISYVVAEIKNMTDAMNAFSDSDGFRAFKELGEIADRLGLDRLPELFISPLGLGRPLVDSLSRREAARQTAMAEAGGRVDWSGRAQNNVVVNVTSADPNAVVDAIRQYQRQNGPLGIQIR